MTPTELNQLVSYIFVFFAWMMMGNVVVRQQGRNKVILVLLSLVATALLLFQVGISPFGVFVNVLGLMFVGAGIGYFWPKNQA